MSLVYKDTNKPNEHQGEPSLVIKATREKNERTKEVIHA